MARPKSSKLSRQRLVRAELGRDDVARPVRQLVLAERLGVVVDDAVVEEPDRLRGAVLVRRPSSRCRRGRCAGACSGESQLSSTWATMPEGNRSVTKATSTTPRTIESRPIARTVSGRSPSQCRRIEKSCGPRSQMTLDVALVQAQVHAARRDEVDVAEHPLVEHPLDGVDGRAVHERVPAQKHAPARAREPQQLVRARRRRRQRLLDERVLAGQQAAGAQLEVGEDRRGDRRRRRPRRRPARRRATWSYERPGDVGCTAPGDPGRCRRSSGPRRRRRRSARAAGSGPSSPGRRRPRSTVRASWWPSSRRPVLLDRLERGVRQVGAGVEDPLDLPLAQLGEHGQRELLAGPRGRSRQVDAWPPEDSLPRGVPVCGRRIVDRRSRSLARRDERGRRRGARSASGTGGSPTGCDRALRAAGPRAARRGRAPRTPVARG